MTRTFIVFSAMNRGRIVDVDYATAVDRLQSEGHKVIFSDERGALLGNDGEYWYISRFRGHTHMLRGRVLYGS